MTYVMTAGSAVELLTDLAAAGVDACIGGGWGVDALLGEQTREHSDLDVWVPTDHLEPLVSALIDHGVDRVAPWPAMRPWNFVLHDGARLRVDLHLYEDLGDGTIHYGSVLAGRGQSFPATALAGSGEIAGLAVRCEHPEWSVRWHTGYPLREVDLHDVRLLCRRFGIALPDGYR